MLSVCLSSIDQIYAHLSRYCMQTDTGALHTANGSRLPCGLRCHRSRVVNFQSSNDTTTHSSSPLVSLPTPLSKAQGPPKGPQSRGEATWRAAGVKFDRLCMPS